jgi:hypothetical protein
LQKEAVKKSNTKPKTDTILNYFWERKEEDMGEEYNSSGAHRTGGIFASPPLSCPGTFNCSAVGSHNALNSYDI